MIPLTECIAQGQREQQSKNCLGFNAGEFHADWPQMLVFLLLFYAAENKIEAQC